MDRIDYELEQHLKSQESGYCAVCDRTLPVEEFEHGNGCVCADCEADGYWQGGVFIDAGDNPYVF